MRKRHLIPILACILLLFCCTAAYAHPGATDANGGHYDHSTGEYHYHHGYPAHQHPDGRCPYNYDDRTGWNSGSSSGGSDSASRPNRRTAPPGYESPKPVEHQAPPRCLPVLLLLSIPVSLIAYKIIKHHVEEQQFRRSGRSRQMARELQEQIDSIRRRRNALRIQILSKELLPINEVVGAPPGAYIDKDGDPHLPDPRHPGVDLCAVACNASSRVVHRPSCRYASLMPTVNTQQDYFLGIHRSMYHRCSICEPNISKFPWVPDYRRMVYALSVLGLSPGDLNPAKPTPPKPLPPPEVKPIPRPTLPRRAENEPREVAPELSSVPGPKPPVETRPDPEPPSNLNLARTCPYYHDGQVITLYAVESSYISHVGYLFSRERLFVRMKSGRVYTYNNIRPELYMEFIHADSVGEFYNQHIKRNHK
nr:MAG TPA: KTSC domain [Caudoviricetes sp.]